MRMLLLDSLKDLSDKTYQLKNWVFTTTPCGFWFSARMSYNVIFNDLVLEDDPEDQIGYSLYNKIELEAVISVVDALKKVLEEIGIEQPDGAYINSPLWDTVVHTSQHAYKCLIKNEILTEEYKDRWNILRQSFHKEPISLCPPS